MPLQGFIRKEASNLPIIEALNEPYFRWFLEWSWPATGALSMTCMTLRDGRQAFILKDPRQGVILQLNRDASGCWSGQQHGAFPLWEHVCHYYGVYEELGKPHKETFRVSFDGEQASLSVISGQTQMILRDLFI